MGSEELGHYIIFYSLTNNFGHIGRDFDIAKDMGWSASYTGGVSGSGNNEDRNKLITEHNIKFNKRVQ